MGKVCRRCDAVSNDNALMCERCGFYLTNDILYKHSLDFITKYGKLVECFCVKGYNDMFEDVRNREVIDVIYEGKHIAINTSQIIYFTESEEVSKDKTALTDKDKIDNFFKDVFKLALKHDISCIENMQDNTIVSFEYGIIANLKIRFKDSSRFINYHANQI